METALDGPIDGGQISGGGSVTTYTATITANGGGGDFEWNVAPGPFIVTIPATTHGIDVTTKWKPIVQFRNNDGSFHHGIGVADYSFKDSNGDLVIEQPVPDTIEITMI